MKNIPIVLTFDNNMSLAAGVCISSIMMSGNKDNFHDFFVLHSGPEPEICGLESILKAFPNMRLQYRSVGDVFKGAFEIRGITSAAYYRLLTSELVPEYDKVIYADVDMVIRLDMEPLLEREMGSNYLGAVYGLSMNLSEERQKYVESIGATPGKYFLSGFLLMNLKAIRENRLVPRFIELSKGKYKYQDQDIMNIVCKGHIMSIPYVYSMVDSAFGIVSRNETVLLSSEYMQTEDNRDPLLYSNIHFNGAKPWKTWCPNLDQWWECYRKSPIYDPSFYFNYFNSKLTYLDQLSLSKRIKILLRYFIYGRVKYNN